MNWYIVFWIIFLSLLLFIGFLLRVYDLAQKRKEKRSYRIQLKKGSKRMKPMTIGKMTDYIVEQEKDEEER